MVNFSKLIAQENQPPEIDPRRLFGSLHREYDYLRDVQGDVLDEWHGRRNERDLVIKMNTGAGKTVVGLVILQSLLNEGKGPALYLCPDLYLVSQVQREAERLGIKCVGSGQGEPLPPEFYDSSAILVINAYKLFNGRSLFGVAGRPSHVSVGAVVVDDAHKCVDIAHEQFSARFLKESPVWKSLISFFESELKQQGVSLWADIVEGKGDTCIRVPYWAWQERLDDIANLFSKNADSEELKFVWQFLKERGVLENSTAVVSGERIEIAPFLLPIDLVPSFDRANHRVYMSATLLDDASLVKDFAADADSVKKPIRPKIGGDIGERLIISPSLVDPSLEGTIASGLVPEIRSAHQANVVVLVPSFGQAENWKLFLPDAKVASRDDISDLIGQLSDSDSNVVIFANRYDGIDLPDKACRVLVFDGLPQEHRLVRVIEATERQPSPILNRQIAQRIEQGIGRGVRSRSDYCVVILTGSKLVPFMSQVDNQSLFTEDTKRQIEAGKRLSVEIKSTSANSYKAILELVSQCLNRNPGWQTYHRNALQGSQSTPVSTDTDLAVLELNAWQFALKSNYSKASDEIGNLIKSNDDLSDGDTGWYLQKQAEYLHHVDKASAFEKQIKAHDFNRRLLKPPEGIMYRKLQAKHTEQAYAALAWMKRFSDPNAMVIAAQEVIYALAFGVNHNTFEEALKDLSEIIGFDAQRPDKEAGRGPDVLWRLDNGRYLVIEAKNQVRLDRAAIYKAEAEQLCHHATWFEQNYTGQPYTPVLIHPADTLSHDAYLPDGTKIVQEGDLQQLGETVNEFVASLTTKPASQWSPQDIQQQLTAYKLRSIDFLNNILRKGAKKASR